MSTATMRRGETAAAFHLAACPDERLMHLGLGTADIRAVRTGTFQGVRR